MDGIRVITDVEQDIIIASLERILTIFDWYPHIIDMDRIRFLVQTDNDGPGNYVENHPDTDVIILYHQTLMGPPLALDLVVIQELTNSIIHFPSPADIVPDSELTLVQNATRYAVIIESLEIGGVIDGLWYTLQTQDMIPHTIFNQIVLQYAAGEHEPYYTMLQVHTPANMYHRRYLSMYGP